MRKPFPIALGAVVIGGILICSRTLGARQQACADRSRQQAVVNVARTINSLEMNNRPRMPYQPLSAFPQARVPDGVLVQLAVSADGSQYVFSVKDAADPCGFAVFSDQEGVIYRAQPLQ